MRWRVISLLTAVLLALFAAELLRAEPPLTAEQSAMIDSFHVYVRASRPEVIMAVADSLLPSARAAGDSGWARTLILWRGMAGAAFGRGRSCEPDLRLGRDLAAAAADTVDLLQAERWLGVSLSLQGRREEALAVFNGLHELATVVGDSFHIGWALVGVAYDHLVKEESHRSADVYGHAADIFATIGEVGGELWARQGQGMALRKLGRFREATASFWRIVELARASGNRMTEAMAFNSLGALEMAFGDPSRAVAHLENARAIHLERNHMREAVAPALNLARAWRELGRLDEAAAGLQPMLALCQREGYQDLEALILELMAQIRQQQGRHREALDLGRQVMALGSEVSPGTRCSAARWMAAALTALDSTRAALSMLDSCAVALRGGENLVASMEMALARGRLRVEVEQPRAALALLGPARAACGNAGLRGLELEMLVVSARAWVQVAQPDSSLTALRSAAKLWEAERAMPTEPEWRERRGAAAAELFPLAARILLTHPPGRPAPERVAAAFDFLQRYKARTLRERMLGPGQELAPADTLPPVTLSTLQREILHPGELFLDVHVAKRQGVIVAVTRDTCVAVDMPGQAALDDRFALFLDLLSAPAREGDDPNLLAYLSRQLALELASDLRPLVRRASLVVWSPDGILHGLPLAVVPDTESAAEAPAVWRDLPLVRVPSASVLATLRTRGETTPTRPLLALAARPMGHARDLPGAAAEVAWLARRFRDVTTCDPWREDQVRAELAGSAAAPFGAIHFATHAEIDGERPWNSQLELPGGAPLRAGEIARMDLGAQLVVLSSCASGRGQVIAGEGVLGLASGFISAGIPAVVATLWPVDDAATARFMAAFYEELARGAPAAAALQRAQATCRDDPATAHPFFWAGFVLIGDGTVDVPLATRAGRPWPWLAAAGIGLAVAGLITSRRRSRPAARE